MFINTKNYSEEVSEELKEDNEGKYNEPKFDFKKVFSKYKYFLFIFLILIVVIFFIFLNSKNKVKKVEKGTVVFYLGESGSYDYEFKDSISSSSNYDVSIKDTKIANIENQVETDKGLKFLFKPNNLGKTELSLHTKDGNKEVEEVVNIVVCKKLSIDSLSSSTINMKKGTQDKLLLDIGSSKECTEGVSVFSDNESIVKYEDGILKAINAGKANLTITQKDTKINLVVVVSDNLKLISSINFNNDKKLTLKSGAKTVITYKIEPSDASNKYLSWSSSNENVATVTQKGVVTAISPGEAIISVSSLDGSNIKKEIYVSVISSENNSNTSKVKNVSFTNFSVSLVKGNTTTLKYNITPSNASYKQISFSSKDTSIATVDKTGKVKAIDKGKTEITITVINNDDTKVQSSIPVTVSSPTSVNKVEKVSFTSSSISLVKGNTTTLKYNITPSNASYKQISFSSKNTSIATVDKTGKVKAVAKGKTEITITVVNSDNTKAQSSISINVSEAQPQYINAKKVTINGSYFLDIDEEVQIKYSIEPSNANISKVTFKSEVPDEVAVTDTGKLIPKKIGGDPQITITVTNKDGTKVEDKTRVLVVKNVNILDPTATNITSTSADFTATFSNTKNKNVSETGIFIWENGKTKPSNATYKTKGISSSTNISFKGSTMNLTLSPSKTYKFVIYAVAGGRMYTSTEGKFTTKEQINYKVSFTRKYAAVEVGSTYSLPITITPQSSSVKPTYTSANTGIATVDSSGKITGKKVGATTVTAKYGSSTATINVRVVGKASKSSPALVYDISEYNTVSSWDSMKQKGINYLILRLGITSTFNGYDARVDKKFDTFVNQTRKNNFEIGVYYFSKANSAAVAKNEANFVLKTLNSYPKGTFSLPVYIDFEQSNQQFNQTGVNYINEFCNVIEAGGYYCGAYTFYYMYTNYKMASSVKSYWVPDWTCSTSASKSVTNLGMWQFAAPDSSSCRTASHYGLDFADNNYMYVNYSTQIINLGLNNFK